MRGLLVRWVEDGGLRHLGSTHHWDGDKPLPEMLETGIVEQLISLDLSRTSLSDRGARVILENAERFGHLESLDLSGNDLSEGVTDLLEKRFELVVDVEEQGGPDDLDDDDDE